MQRIFDDILHKNVECYVDDLVVKSRQRRDHLNDLRKIFDRLRKYQLKMDPLKCAFGVTSGKFLGFVVRHRGIEVDQSKIDVIMKMPKPRNIHELKSLQGKLAYIRRFISNLAGRCHPFHRLMKKGTPFEWDEACENAFNSIKAYLSKPPVLNAPIQERPLILYIASQETSTGFLLAQKNDNGKENALYYLSRTLTGAELNYTPIKKTCLALMFAIQKLRHYLQAHSVRLISRADPLKYIMFPQKAVKGQALADFLADHPIPDNWKVSEELPDEEVMLVDTPSPWKMFFDGSATQRGTGAGVVFVTSDGDIIPYAYTLTQLCSNNMAEYQALILGLEMAMDNKLHSVRVYGDSKLVINQLLSTYEVRKPELLPYHDYAVKLTGWFPDITISHIPRKENAQADALASLASALTSVNREVGINCAKSFLVRFIFTP
ncbi:hypothetical protein MLD38_011074 [Melastoma candidum]|uniref:Uncharacterized protein n=1 Tax=Melastoma candidum TaxID=119954 RepID=A0ACB9RA73_9MYRT|nr:hypothetical protein MLD38_011074 [Melastoma candidum]